MGCANGKSAGETEPISDGGVASSDVNVKKKANTANKEYVDAKGPEMKEIFADADTAGSPPAERRLSVRYSARDQSSGRTSSRRNSRGSAPFDRSRIGVHTKHGLRPGPRGQSAAKINQDRGVVCWPYNNSFNQALLCIFDGHGRNGEKVSEYCTTTVPELLEEDHDLLQRDPTKCLSTNIVRTDQLLFASELGAKARNCGTTSTVVYLRGSDCWCACSGDSRAVKGANQGGKVVALDLTNDHKPDLPEEKKRILAAGGTVTPAGPDGRPSRMYANGHVGLAMSRSLGDGLCKDYGCIPDPEIQHFSLKLPPKAGPQGEEVDSFLIVASDGVWEFITSQEACEIVSKCESASDAVENLVNEACARWRQFEGSYRDDITAIIVYLPFLDDGNEAATGDEGIVSEHSNDFVKRRLSVVGGLVGDGGDGDSWADGED